MPRVHRDDANAGNPWAGDWSQARKRPAPPSFKQPAAKRAFNGRARDNLGVNRNRIEYKWADIDNFDVAPGGIGDAGMGIVILNSLAEGTGPTQRIGRKVFLKSLQMVGLWERNPEADADNIFPEHMIRCAIIYDRQPTGGYPNFADFYLSQDTNGDTTSTGLSMKNMNNISRFVWLKEWDFLVPQLIPGDNEYYWDGTATNGAGVATADALMSGAGVGTTFGATNASVLKIFFPINLETVYNAATAVVGSISTGALYLIMWRTKSQGAGTPPTDPYPLRLRGSFRLKFEG